MTTQLSFEKHHTSVYSYPLTSQHTHTHTHVDESTHIRHLGKNSHICDLDKILKSQLAA